MIKERDNGKIIATYTLGCKVNQFETQAMEQLFAQRGYRIGSFEEFADIYIVNTCTVTAMSDKKSRQMIRRAKKLNPLSALVVVGCYSQKAPEEVLAIEGVDLVMGTSNRDKVVDEVERLLSSSDEDFSRIRVEDIMKKRSFEQLEISDMRGKTRAFLKIQEGCDRFCSYCIIPFTRGPVRSQQLGPIISQVEKLAENGFSEVVLTGTHVASYGKDLDRQPLETGDPAGQGRIGEAGEAEDGKEKRRGGVRLADVIEAAAKVEGIRRVRTSSVEPLIITEEFLSRVREVPEFCPHFHLSLQSGCDSVLRRMNRRYDTARYREAVHRIRSVYPEAAITTDVIVGFPGETEEEFDQTYAFLQEMNLYEMHIFKYSEREGTAAAKMKDRTSPEQKNKRSEILLALAQRNKRAFEERFLGTTEEVLFEMKTDQGWEGHTKNYLKVFADSEEDLEGCCRNVRLIARREEGILGELL